MAVQQNHTSRSKRGMRRSHDALSAASLSIDPTSKEVHMRHCVTPGGFYRGKQVIVNKVENDEEASEVQSSAE